MDTKSSATHQAVLDGKQYLLKQITKNEQLQHNRFEAWSEQAGVWFPVDMVTIKNNVDSIKPI